MGVCSNAEFPYWLLVGVSVSFIGVSIALIGVLLLLMRSGKLNG